MAVRAARAGSRQLYTPEQRKLLEDLLDVIDKHETQNTTQVLEVLTVMTATLVTTHSVSRYACEEVMARIVMKMDEIIEREPWSEERPEIQRH